MKRVYVIQWGVMLVLLVSVSVPSRSQTLDDGLLMAERALCTGFIFSHDSWDHYWEGTLKRDNENIGTLTTRSVIWMGSYGITNRLTAVAMLPYVWTRTSVGVLHGMSGFQDLTAGAKYRILSTPFTSRGAFDVFVSGYVGIPVSNYTPDFLPLSIGLGSRRFSSRLNLQFRSRDNWYLLGSAAYTWRLNVKLERHSYYTDGQLFLSNEVAMPDVFDYTVSFGYRNRRFHFPLSVTQQVTLGGGDIRRQDMPFVSNRMNFIRIDAAAIYTFSKPDDLLVRAGITQIVDGRNVGESTAFSAGLLYTFHL